MAPTIQPTRTSKRIAEMNKKKAAVPKATINKPKPKPKRAKRGPLTTGGKVTKAKKKALVARAKKLRYFITHDQHAANDWVDGQVCVAADGQKVPVGSIEVVIKVPLGMKFLLFPEVLRLVETKEGEEEEIEEEMEEEMEEEIEEEMEEEIEREIEEDTEKLEAEEESESELSECGYVSDVHF